MKIFSISPSFGCSRRRGILRCYHTWCGHCSGFLGTDQNNYNRQVLRAFPFIAACTVLTCLCSDQFALFMGNCQIAYLTMCTLVYVSSNQVLQHKAFPVPYGTTDHRCEESTHHPLFIPTKLFDGKRKATVVYGQFLCQKCIMCSCSARSSCYNSVHIRYLICTYVERKAVYKVNSVMELGNTFVMGPPRLTRSIIENQLHIHVVVGHSEASEITLDAPSVTSTWSRIGLSFGYK